jgi:hypothetical protein
MTYYVNIFSTTFLTASLAAASTGHNLLRLHFGCTVPPVTWSEDDLTSGFDACRVSGLASLLFI